ncbi:MAG: integrase [Rhodocyclales bacterium GT-UBC]|nr:MAG: integrase [Rhodocyclales bacterium GT-UBC]
MAPRPRSRRNTGLPLNVYTNRGAYVWRHPVTGKVYGLGSNRQAAFAQAHEANLTVLDLLEKPRLVHRIAGRPETLFDWLETYKGILDKRFDDEKIAKSTRDNMKQRCNTIAEAIGETILKELTTRTIADFLKRYDGKERMAQAMRSLLLDIFREAVAAGWCERNPVEVTRAERVETKRQRLSLDQFMAIHAKAKEKGPIWLVHFLELAILTGQRRGDLAKMRYKDMQDVWLNVVQQKNKKTDAVGHKVAIPLELQIAGFSLQATIASTRNVVSQYLVHHIKQAGRAKVGSKIREHTIAEEFAAIREEVGIVGDNPPTIHEIRSLSARLYKDKYGEEFAQALLGHKSVKMAALYQDERDGWFRPKIAG